jgi:hypothetical protein
LMNRLCNGGWCEAIPLVRVGQDVVAV